MSEEKQWLHVSCEIWQFIGAHMIAAAAERVVYDISALSDEIDWPTLIIRVVNGPNGSLVLTAAVKGVPLAVKL